MTTIGIPDGWAAVLIAPDGTVCQVILPMDTDPGGLASEACHIAAGLMAATQDELVALTEVALRRVSARSGNSAN